MKPWLSALSLLLFFTAGVCLSWFSNQFSPEMVAQVSRGSRDPAAIRRVYDFSNLDGSALSTASKQRILSGFETFRDADKVGIALGHFVVRGPDGRKQFACAKYNKVVMAFEGEGMAVGGEKPTMRISGPCSEGEDINQISPLYVPVSQILTQPVSDGEFDFREGQNVVVSFSSVADQWPTQWVLTSVKLTNDESEEVTIERDEIRTMVDRPMVVEFQSF